MPHFENVGDWLICLFAQTFKSQKKKKRMLWATSTASAPIRDCNCICICRNCLPSAIASTALVIPTEKYVNKKALLSTVMSASSLLWRRGDKQRNVKGGQCMKPELALHWYYQSHSAMQRYNLEARAWWEPLWYHKVCCEFRWSRATYHYHLLYNANFQSFT